jgi:D-xylose 1-dehydrogenase (NADP+, D-xylono-1,5-lactone-forming)
MANQRKVKWGVLGAANIALKKVIPGMQQGEWSEITGIASRDLKKAQEAARSLDANGVVHGMAAHENVVGPDNKFDRSVTPTVMYRRYTGDE